MGFAEQRMPPATAEGKKIFFGEEHQDYATAKELSREYGFAVANSKRNYGIGMAWEAHMEGVVRELSLDPEKMRSFRRKIENQSQSQRWRHTPEYRKFKEQVKVRAGYICEQCGSDSQLDVHHKKPAHEGGLKYNPSNGELLCKLCHRLAGWQITVEKQIVEREARRELNGWGVGNPKED